MSENVLYFAQRRPDWQLPSLKIDELNLDSFEPLLSMEGRKACPLCGKSRAMYCYDCLTPFTSIPSIELPFQLHIVTHTAEAAAKATGVQAAVLCPGQVHLQSIEALPQLDPAECVVMFPSEDALLPDQLPLEQLKHVILIDSKWRKAKELNGHQALAGMKRVKLPGNPRSSFWRFHTEGTADEGVCTIEAIHLFMRALADRLPRPQGYWDNLLWYYAYQHKVIEKASAQRAAKRQQAERQGGYAKQKKRREQQQQQQQQEQQPGQQAAADQHCTANQQAITGPNAPHIAQQLQDTDQHKQQLSQPGQCLQEPQAAAALGQVQDQQGHVASSNSECPAQQDS